MRRPLAIDLFCGLGGWADGLLAEGWDVIGFDIERHQYGQHRYPAQLVIQDVLTLHGSQFRSVDLIVASPPCQFFSYTAMPWTRAKRLAEETRADAAKTDAELALFRACFRIQREACEAAGRHIPLIVENVKGAQPWVGRARWNFGSFYLWGDVPALMPSTKKAKIGNGAKVNGVGWTGFADTGASWRNRETAIKNAGGSWFAVSHNKVPHSRGDALPVADGRKASSGGADGWFGDYAAMKEGIKQRGSGREWFAGDGRISRMTSSNSPARKMASAMIAKIPAPLARHIAAAWSPAINEPKGEMACETLTHS